MTKTCKKLGMEMVLGPKFGDCEVTNGTEVWKCDWVGVAFLKEGLPEKKMVVGFLTLDDRGMPPQEVMKLLDTQLGLYD